MGSRRSTVFRDHFDLTHDSKARCKVCFKKLNARSVNGTSHLWRHPCCRDSIARQQEGAPAGVQQQPSQLLASQPMYSATNTQASQVMEASQVMAPAAAALHQNLLLLHQPLGLVHQQQYVIAPAPAEAASWAQPGPSNNYGSYHHVPQEAQIFQDDEGAPAVAIQQPPQLPAHPMYAAAAAQFIDAPLQPPFLQPAANPWYSSIATTASPPAPSVPPAGPLPGTWYSSIISGTATVPSQFMDAPLHQQQHYVEPVAAEGPWGDVEWPNNNDLDDGSAIITKSFEEDHDTMLHPYLKYF